MRARISLFLIDYYVQKRIKRLTTLYHAFRIVMTIVDHHYAYLRFELEFSHSFDISFLSPRRLYTQSTFDRDSSYNWTSVCFERSKHDKMSRKRGEIWIIPIVRCECFCMIHFLNTVDILPFPRIWKVLYVDCVNHTIIQRSPQRCIPRHQLVMSYCHAKYDFAAIFVCVCVCVLCRIFGVVRRSINNKNILIVRLFIRSCRYLRLPSHNEQMSANTAKGSY